MNWVFKDFLLIRGFYLSIEVFTWVFSQLFLLLCRFSLSLCDFFVICLFIKIFFFKQFQSSTTSSCKESFLSYFYYFIQEIQILKLSHSNTSIESPQRSHTSRVKIDHQYHVPSPKCLSSHRSISFELSGCHFDHKNYKKTIEMSILYWILWRMKFESNTL